MGRHDELGSTTFSPDDMWKSLNHLLDSVATALKNSTPLGRYEATVVDGRLDWQLNV
ncbi:hypothetical protein [Streptomyces sp. NPDC058622]|uniref:hypothetical protein n=1 Tax=Streptomyces sp. NPDC058622 TaxID=3346562 RepID=UPI00364B12D2